MATQKKNIQTPLRIAINSRLLFNTKAEAEQYLGIRELDNVKSESKLLIYSSKMDEKCMELCMTPLKDFVDLYSKAINKYNSKTAKTAPSENNANQGMEDETDTGRRHRSELRRQLAVKLFIWTFLCHTKSGRVEAQSKISNMNYPEKSFEAYYSKATQEERIDVCFTVLLHWGIVKPFESNTYDYNDDIEKNGDRRKTMLELLTLLQRKLPEVGIFGAGNLPALNIAIKSVNKSLVTGHYPTTAEYWLMLRQIGCAAFLSSQGDSMGAADMETYPVRLPGIWMDNGNSEGNRFWVFPDNYQYAFCFINKGEQKWEIDIYECFVCSPRDSDGREYIVWHEAEESKQVILNGGRGCNGDKICYTYFNTEKDADGEICKLYLISMKSGLECPLPFTELHRLSPNDNMFEVAKNQLLRAHAKSDGNLEMVNVVNSLFAVDREYIYLYDYDLGHVPFAMQIINEKGDFIRFHYGVVIEEEDKEKKKEKKKNFQYYNLCNVGKHSNIIRIPRNIKDNSWRNRWLNVIQDIDWFDRIVYALENINIDGVVTIYDLGNKDREKIIFFNDFSVGFSTEQFKRVLNDNKIKADLSHWISYDQ